MAISHRHLSLSRAISACDFSILNLEILKIDDTPMTDGNIEEQTHNALNEIKKFALKAGCELYEGVRRIFN